MVIPKQAVHLFAERLREHQPTRAVLVIPLPGSHCGLAEASPTEYMSTIAAFLQQATTTGVVLSANRSAVLLPTPSTAEVAARATDMGMGGFLQDHGLDRLAAALGDALTLDESFELLDDGRPALLNRLKELGVAKLADRQALANALGKKYRASRA